jgi:D-alanine-D-alanine ligase
MCGCNVVIVFGGSSHECNVSVATAQYLTSALPQARLWHWSGDDGAFREVSPNTLLAHRRPFELAFCCSAAPFCADFEEAIAMAAVERSVLVVGLHGGLGENGEFAFQCESRGVPFTGSGSMASRIAFHKAAAKTQAISMGLRVPDTINVSCASDLKRLDIRAFLRRHRRLVAKPQEDGSSIGLMFIESEEQLPLLIDSVGLRPYTIEAFVPGVEVTVPVIRQGGQDLALAPVEIEARPGRVFDYAGKYLPDGLREIYPARLPKAVIDELRTSALAIHRGIGAFGYSRTDMIVGPYGPVFLEINTLPGLSHESILPRSLAHAGIPFEAFLQEQIRLANARSRARWLSSRSGAPT